MLQYSMYKCVYVSASVYVGGLVNKGEETRNSSSLFILFGYL